jgi:outer membrane lipoprotein SlyB
MNRLFSTVTILALVVSPPVYAKGCIKGAIVGGVAGSVVGHGKLGAAAGCVVGHHEANKAENTEAAPQAPSQPRK